MFYYIDMKRNETKRERGKEMDKTSVRVFSGGGHVFFETVKQAKRFIKKHGGFIDGFKDADGVWRQAW